jgi:hypothetical protein
MRSAELIDETAFFLDYEGDVDGIIHVGRITGEECELRPHDLSVLALETRGGPVGRLGCVGGPCRTVGHP